MQEKLRLRESAYILKETEDKYHVVFTNTRKIKTYNVDGLVKGLIDELKDESNRSQVIKNLESKFDSKNISVCLSALEKEGIVRTYNEYTNQRFARQISFIDELTDSWDETLKLQKKLQTSKVSVFGVGGIGTWMVNGLYQIGIGTINIADLDVVQESNLNRQLFFNEGDIGKYKVDVMKEKLPNANINSYKNWVSESQDLTPLVKGVDFLVNCADNPSIHETTKIIDTFATKYNVPYCVAGGYNMHLGMVGPIIMPGKTAKFEDFLRFQKENDPLKGFEMIKDIEQTGSLGPIAGAVANIQVMEIFKHLIDKGKRNYNRFAEIDFMDFKVEWREFGPQPSL
ncbi:MAG: ThiF family adenylyltransferase [Nanoarchaeota archaeon]|nr:ThiF family adenylyltransferase [Nanoarchaeota archaeon]